MHLNTFQESKYVGSYNYLFINYKTIFKGITNIIINLIRRKVFPYLDII